jgi:hypothetical protein
VSLFYKGINGDNELTKQQLMVWFFQSSQFGDWRPILKVPETTVTLCSTAVVKVPSQKVAPMAQKSAPVVRFPK